MTKGLRIATTTTMSGVRELTVRAIVVGGLITVAFTAANVNLGLKVGLTCVTSIPAAVISMGVLRNFVDHTIVENNIVQTIASAADCGCRVVTLYYARRTAACSARRARTHRRHG